MTQKTIKIFDYNFNANVPNSFNDESKPKLKVCSLFSGYGSQELALKYAGIDYEVVSHSDINENSNKVYRALHGDYIPNLGDISKIDEKTFPDCDLLTYSFPCQDLSIAGIQKGIKKGTRSGLLYEVERIVNAKKPKYLLMENVKNLVSKRHMKSFQEHINFLSDLGYGTYWRVFNGADFGCAQNRERVFMMSVLGESKKEVKYRMMEVDNHKKKPVAMRPLLENEFDSELVVTRGYTPYLTKKDSVCKRVASVNGVSYNQCAGIFSIDKASPCITKSGRPKIMLDNNEVRYITAREAYRFMGIKDSDIDKMFQVALSQNQHCSLAGDSICVPVMEAIFSEFFKEKEVVNLLWTGLRVVA